MTVEECEHGELPGFPCPPCDRQRIPQRDDAHGEWSRPFRAVYDGACSGCGFGIAVGAAICGRDTDQGKEYRHAGACCEE